MLEVPSILMLNCLGSYFYSIVKHISQPGAEHVLLYYLSQGKMAYHPLSLEKVREKYGNNPWGYQPIVVDNSQGGVLAIDEVFFKYLLEKHHISIETIDMNENDGLVMSLSNNTKEGQFNIYNVDEYYIPESPQFYKKQHNKHFLLIKSVDRKAQKFEVIDSEKNSTFLLAFDDMDRAVYQSKYKMKLLYRIDGCSYTDKVDKSEAWQNFKGKIKADDFILSLVEDMSQKLFSNERDYFYKGYYYAILSKALPYAQMVYFMLKDNEICFCDKSLNIVNEWRMLCNYMRFKMRKRDKSYDFLAKRLNRIHQANSELLFQLQKV